MPCFALGGIIARIRSAPGDLMPSPIEFVRGAVRAVPAVCYALGVGGIVSVLSIMRLLEHAQPLGVIRPTTLLR
jgi:hypothetical protein